MLFGKYNGQHTKQKKAGKSRKGRERARGANDLGRHREGQGRDNVLCLRFCFHYRNIENEIERNAWQTHLYASRAAMMTTLATLACCFWESKNIMQSALEPPDWQKGVTQTRSDRSDGWSYIMPH